MQTVIDLIACNTVFMLEVFRAAAESESRHFDQTTHFLIYGSMYTASLRFYNSRSMIAKVVWQIGIRFPLRGDTAVNRITLPQIDRNVFDFR